MKVGILCYPSYGGSGVIASDLARHLARRGHEVHVFSYETPFRLQQFEANLFFHQVEVLDYPLFRFPPYLIALTSKIVDVARTAQLDLLHVHYAIPHTPAAYLAREMLARERKLPIITTTHGTDITLVGKDPQFFEVIRFSLESSDGVTAVSHNLAIESKEVFGLEKTPRVIPNFVDVEAYIPQQNPALRSRFALPEEKLLLHISNFRPIKRLEDVVKIFAGVNQVLPSRLLLVGDGPEKVTALQMAQQLAVEERVHFLGRQENVAEIFALSDLFLLPSEKESFGLVALEAMACEVPVVASKTGGLPEVVEHGLTGYLAPVGHTDAMIEGSLKILSNPLLHRQMAERGRKVALSRFRAEPIVDAYEQYYKEILNES
ncbi:N-acetyl-alpha-D-glucosaminyl L-malate synthase BshA [Heliorestis acidaminivorans]|uniref:N-acetyl-alpha-D-glucosaminyl L-malate synthase BshA n=1 Tax=Heliorestis acidaminivorans TaxID=553427 RepID=A0A6I0EXM1_9FIRM|nr:N-acetyl-alpha-D-glucosaminyl L-malate synthase BshA [Heliorestis acidaminivorans]KAB2954539.1 N-acetyl-alpha-D-glucosaminyl L-malate synthase BshA [Heliorestis acidaminivorans]